MCMLVSACFFFLFDLFSYSATEIHPQRGRKVQHPPVSIPNPSHLSFCRVNSFPVFSLPSSAPLLTLKPPHLDPHTPTCLFPARSFSSFFLVSPCLPCSRMVRVYFLVPTSERSTMGKEGKVL
ncbi:hypothetical protein F5H01DRAFT_348566 [Linnemannia elongata]|nr:hypothetical protein F5H01DRAFT_348566 [Linnemannia elongata]